MNLYNEKCKKLENLCENFIPEIEKKIFSLQPLLWKFLIKGFRVPIKEKLSPNKVVTLGNNNNNNNNNAINNDSNNNINSTNDPNPGN